MLFFVVAIALFAASNAAPVTTVEDVNNLIDKAIKEIQAHKAVDIPGLKLATVEGLEYLRRHGNCVKSTKTPGVFQCKAIADEAHISAEGDKALVTILITFAVAVDSEGRLAHFKVENTEIILKGAGEVFYVSFWKKVGDFFKKEGKEVLKVAETALHGVVEGKVNDLVQTLAGSLIG